MKRVVRESFSGLPREFWWLWTATLINSLGGFVGIFLALYLTTGLGYSASFTGFVGSLYGGGAVVAAILGGFLTDRIGRTRTILTAQVTTGLSTLALGFADSAAVIAVMAFVVGVAGAAARPAIGATIADLTEGPERQKAFSLNYWAGNLGFGASAAIVGMVAEHGFRPLFVVEATATFVCGILVYARVPETGAQRIRGHVRDSRFLAGYASVCKDLTFMGIVGMTFLMALLFQQAATALPITMGIRGFSSADYGMVISLNGFMIVLLQVLLSRAVKSVSPRRVLAASALLCGYGLALVVCAGSLPFYFLAVAVWTLGEMTFAPVIMNLVSHLSPAAARGRYQGTYQLAFSGAALVAPLSGGYVIDHFGVDTVWITCGAIGTVAAVGYALLGRAAEERSSDTADLTAAATH
ncbi:MFS transporter [Streptomyces sp. NRRL S-87]|uniref:MDR family MFS transporter n=1 Tax=Streptomyces sp. NRRL S-87 TaxID=1463920 RepID=UPI00056C9E9F|nr:MFS transporter [Streptomyces sp. NRRL S-87]